MRIVLPRSGSAALAYYRQFPSHAIAQWMRDELRNGMTVIDVGAHVGVYSLFAARLIEPDGIVHAIEPQEALLACLSQSAALNGLENVRIHATALAAVDGPVGFEVDSSSMGGRMVSPATEASVIEGKTLSSFCSSERIHHVDLVKLDAAGNEFAVLEGGRDMLARKIDRIVCKLYHPSVVAERFGDAGAPADVVRLLRDYGFDVRLPGDVPARDDALRAYFARGDYSVPAFAVAKHVL